tara:strand:- start:225 stop:419 length:195 start_codon:yes stop_codon:yes gene_type:complete
MDIVTTYEIDSHGLRIVVDETGDVFIKVKLASNDGPPSLNEICALNPKDARRLGNLLIIAAGAG